MSGVYIILDLDADCLPLGYYHELDEAIQATENEMLRYHQGRRYQLAQEDEPLFQIQKAPYDRILSEDTTHHARCVWDSLNGKYQ